MIQYSDLGGNKTLSEIVIAGSHDAAITRGGGNVQTQHVDIFVQAYCGVRFFDLRIAAATVPGGPGEPKKAELKAFHADGVFQKKEQKMRWLDGVGNVSLQRTKLRAGAFGFGLEKILEDAKEFVTGAGQREFLLLKFDKSTNWRLIAQTCVFTLGDVIYRGAGNLNTTRISQLAGKVIVLFPMSGLNEVRDTFSAHDGILGWKNLCNREGAAYQKTFDGLQYFGKGGTSPFKPFDKISQNVSGQRKILERAEVFPPEVIRMMYWTTTGLMESIKKRNQKMWTPPNVERMRTLWRSGLRQYTEYTSPLYGTLPPESAAIGATIKRAMPNIIMIDFADTDKCQTIYDLNFATAENLAMAAQAN
ncbi:MAG TPA: hypothetical protein VKX39_05945 [Bryobacteraceae bacterium]|nr:hypothetical protein [Bryobacteraceae bacterium]